MTDTHQISNTEAADVMETMDELLGELELDAMSAEADVEEIEVIEADDMSDEEAAALDNQIAIGEAYESQAEAAISSAPINLNPVAPAKVKAAKAPKAPKVASAPKVSRDLSTLDAAHFRLDSAPIADMEVNKAAVIALRPGQKKIAEKFDNLLTSLAGGKRPSKYTMDCFEILKTKGEVTSAELVAAMRLIESNRSSVYTEGTARSQVGQFMTLAAALKIAERSKQSLKFNPDSTLGAALAAL